MIARLVLVACLLAGCAIRVDRVVENGSGVEGFVREPGGRAIVGADIDVQQPDGDAAETIEPAHQSDETGWYRVNLRPGSYVVVAHASGYDVPIRIPFTVRDRVFTRVDLDLVPRLAPAP